MIITIYKGTDSHSVLLGSKDHRFAEAWGSVYRAPVNCIYDELSNITRWVNNELKEECLFEVD